MEIFQILHLFFNYVKSAPQLLCVTLLVSMQDLVYDCFMYPSRSFGLCYLAFEQEKIEILRGCFPVHIATEIAQK